MNGSFGERHLTPFQGLRQGRRSAESSTEIHWDRLDRVIDSLVIEGITRESDHDR